MGLLSLIAAVIAGFTAKFVFEKCSNAQSQNKNI